MAKMRIGTKTVTPVRNIPSYHGDDIIEILNNEELSNALDGKVDKVSASSVFYGTDYNGNQTTYDLSILLDTETAPDGYTDVEYISSGDENTQSFGQYINTGLVFENYEYGHAVYDMQSSQVGQYFQTWWVESKGNATQTTINQMSSLIGEDITRMKFVMNRTQSSTSLTLYAVDSEGNETSFTTYANDTVCQDSCGITMTWGSLSDGDYVYYDYYPKAIDTWGIETSLRFSDQELANSSNYICGSMSMYGNFGCGLRCTENDGILYKHYTPNAQNGFRIPYNKGNWNKIKMEPGTFTLNGESSAVSTSGDIRTVPGQNFILFGVTREDGVKTSSLSMKKTKIYKNGLLVFNGIPCVEDSSGIAGMYDLVSQQFFKSAKEGVEFIAGPLYEAEDRLNLGVKGTNVILGLDKEGKIASYTGKNGIVIESIIGLDDYEELEYVESTDGHLAFDTQRYWGIPGTNMTGTTWEVTYYQTYTSASSGGQVCQFIFGDGMFTDMGQNFNRIDYRMYNGEGAFPYTSTNGNKGSGSSDGLFMESLEIWHTFAFNYQTLYLDGAGFKTLDYPIAQVAHNKNFHIFNAPNVIDPSSQFQDGFIGRISNVKEIYSNTTLSNFVPVRRKSDNAIGFYDTVNGVFCPNIGEGIPVAGPIKTGTISLEKSLDCFLENIATDKDTSLMITTPTLPSSSTAKNLDGTGNLVIGPYGEITSNSVTHSIAINGQVQANYSTLIGKDAISTASSTITIGYKAYTVGSNAIAIGNSDSSMSSFSVGERSVVIGDHNQSNGHTGVVLVGAGSYAPNGNNQVGVGRLVSVNGTNSVSIGYYSQTFESYGIAIGGNARTNGAYGIAIGNTSSNADENRTLAYEYSVAVGSKARATGSNSVVIGKEATANGDSSVCIGASASTGSIHTCVAVGANSVVSGGWGTAVGYSTQASESAVAVGRGCQATGPNDVTIGNQCSATGANSIAMGHSARSSNNNEVALGTNAQADGGGSVAIGESAKAGNRSTAIGGMCSATNSASIAIGHASSTVNANEAMAIGLYAKAPNSHAVSLGYKAETGATGAIQLGEGTNNSQNTLQFMSYPLVNSDGIMPYGRLSEDSPIDGYVLSYDEDNDCLTWVENGEGGGSYELPIASATTLGGIKVGSGLEIDSETGVLSVVEQPSGEGEGVWGQITGNIEDQTDLKEILDSKFEQVQTIPTASNRYNNKVLQYIGISDLLYTHGYVYECQYRKVSQITGTTSDESRFNVTFDARRFEEYCKAYVELDPSEGTYYCDFDEGDNNWHISYNGSELFAISKNNLQYCGIYVDYSGANEPQTDDRVTMNYIKSTNEHAPFGYIWLQTNVQPGGNVVDNVTSTSTTDALSANQGRVLQEQIDTLSSIGQFLAIWDCDTGTARYLDDGYQYTTGNYFIVGTKGTIDDTRSGSWSSEEITSTDNLEVVLDDITLFENKCGKVNRSITFTMETSTSIRCSYDNITYTKMQVYNTFGIEISSKSQGSYTPGDQVIITYVAPVTSYIPVGSEYDSVTGHETSIDDIEVSDMFFYDGENWILLANHSKQITIDQTLDITSTNPVENRVVTNALNNKLSKTSEVNRVYGTTSLGEQIALTLGEDLQINEGELSTTIDLSTKQDVLVDSGEDQNIKTINGESILGSGNIIIQGGSGEGIGTINISNVFCRDSGLFNRYDYTDDLRPNSYKGGYSDIFFTVNAPLDYVKEHRNDLYVTYYRRNQGNGIRKWRLLNDNRIKTNVKMYCWRFRTDQCYDSSFEVWKNDYDLNYQSDETYIYFYTTSDYNDDLYDMYDDNPLIWYSDLRHVGDDFEDDNFSQGCWGTCFNQLTEYGNITDRWDDVDPTDVFERCKKYDISDVVMDMGVEYDPDNGNIWLDKMKGRLYQDNDGNKLYTWSNEWWLNNGRVFAYLDDNDEPIFNRIPSDMSKLSQICQVSQLTTLGYTLVEERPDLTYRRFNLNQTSQNIRNFVNNCRDCTTSCSDQGGNPDLNWRCYFWDYPVQPVRLAECKIFFADEAPFLPGPDFPNDRFSDYTNRAYTLEEIEADEDLTYMLENQHQLIFVLPYDTYYLWMRTLGWTKMVYTHAHICSSWDWDAEYWQREIYRWDYEWYYDEDWDRTYPIPKYDPDTGEQLKVRYEGDQGEDPNYEWLLAQPWDRHNLNRALFMGGQRNLGYYCQGASMGTSTDGMGDFDNRCGILQGTTGYPRWSMRRGTKYFLPIQINIITGKELSHGNTSKSTPFNVKLSITGNGTQSMYSD